MRYSSILLVLLVAGCSAAAPAAPTPPPSPSVSAAPPSPPPSLPARASVEPVIAYPVDGGGGFVHAQTAGPVAGTGGPLLTYRIAVEHGITGIDPAKFADAVAEIYADPRSWPATGRWRLRRAGPGERVDYTVHLATPQTRDELCGGGYDRYTSCRNGDKVVVNVARWARGIPGYGADLATYRAYVVNHETGHRLGLHGCVANPWPILDGAVYSGRSGQYDDPTPTEQG